MNMMSHFSTISVVLICFTSFEIQAAYIDLNNVGLSNLTINFDGISDNFGPYSLSVLVRPQENRVVETPADWRGQIWAELEDIHCTKCQDIVTTIDVAFLQPTKGENNDTYYDFYEISLMKGYNRPLSIEPVQTVLDCKDLTCEMDLQSDCPEENQIRDENRVVQSCLPSEPIFHELCRTSRTDSYVSKFYKCLSYKYRIQVK